MGYTYSYTHVHGCTYITYNGIRREFSSYSNMRLLGSKYYFDLWQLHKKPLSAIVPFVTNIPQEAIYPLYILILQERSSDLKQLDILNIWLLVTYWCWFSLMPCRADLGKWMTKDLDLMNAKVLPEIKVKWGKHSVEEIEENPPKLKNYRNPPQFRKYMESERNLGEGSSLLVLLLQTVRCFLCSPPNKSQIQSDSCSHPLLQFQ